MNRRELLTTAASALGVLSASQVRANCESRDKARNEGRRKIVCLAMDELLVMLTRQDHCYYVVTHRDIPDGCHVLGIHYNEWHRCMLVTLVHESFDIVPDGQHAPILESLGEIVVRNYAPYSAG